jgi:hypothetical protein
MSWRPDERTRKPFGNFSMVSESPKGGGQSAHFIAFPDGRGVRVLPDDHHSGRARSALLLAVVPVLEALGASSAISETGADPLTYLSGYLAGHGLKWEVELGEVTIEEWLTAWFDPIGPEVARQLLEDLAADGWKIEREVTNG